MQYEREIQAACDGRGLRGDGLRTYVAKHLEQDVLRRHGHDPVAISGPRGSGRRLLAQVCHDTAGVAFGRDGELVSVSCAATTGTELMRVLAESYAQAHAGTLLIEDVDQMPARATRAVAALLDRHAEERGQPKPLVLVEQDTTTAESLEDSLDARLSCRMTLAPLWQRRDDIGQLAQHFAAEAAVEVAQADFYGLTRRAISDVQLAVTRAQLESVRKLRQIVRSAFFGAADQVPEVLESEHLAHWLLELGPVGPAEEALELTRNFPALAALGDGLSAAALEKMTQAMQQLIGDMTDQRRSYRNIVERANRLTKVALWRVTGAKTQAEFRRYFGTKEFEMPPKSVAHQVYYQVFPRDAQRDQ